MKKIFVLIVLALFTSNLFAQEAVLTRGESKEYTAYKLEQSSSTQIKIRKYKITTQEYTLDFVKREMQCPYLAAMQQEALTQEPGQEDAGLKIMIGAEVSTNLEGERAIRFMIKGLFQHGPGAEAGLMVGDEIVGVDGISTKNFAFIDELVAKIRGKINTKICLQILRNGELHSICAIREALPLLPH